MTVLELLAERKIAEAVSRGELDDLPGQGRPLDLENDPLVPEDLRAAYRILKERRLSAARARHPEGNRAARAAARR